MFDISNAQKIDGWMADAELIWLAEKASTRRLIVEIGSWLGRSTRAIADNTQGTVYAVDTWKGSDETSHRELLSNKEPGWLLNQFYSNMRNLRTTLVTYQMTSLEAANALKHRSFDMIFIDASHDYDSVRTDFAAWWPNLADDGLFCGHDYEGWGGVTKAVDELFPAAQRGPGSIWYTHKEKS